MCVVELPACTGSALRIAFPVDILRGYVREFLLEPSLYNDCNNLGN